MSKFHSPGASPLPEHLLLSHRTGLPEDLLFLARTHPRDNWPTTARVAQSAEAWLHFHANFRRAGATLSAEIAALRAGETRAATFAARFGSLASRFVSGLEGHHGVEDEHYFPMFAQAEPRLRRGFEILDSDHDAVHGGLARFTEESRALLHALTPEADKLSSDAQFAAEALERDWTTFHRDLRRHLDDEEDIVIPLMIELSRRGATAA